MKKVFFALLCLLPLSGICQDVIVKKNGYTIRAKVLEITKEEVKYKRFDNLDGATITMPKEDVLTISYENGTREMFNNQYINTSSPATTDSVVAITSFSMIDFDLGQEVYIKEAGRLIKGTIVGMNPKTAIIKIGKMFGQKVEKPYSELTKAL